MSANVQNVPVPEHVPAELVLPYLLGPRGAMTERDPYNDLAAQMHAGPEIVYAQGIYPGGVGAWVPRRTEDLRAIYADIEHFSNRNRSPLAKAVGQNWELIPTDTDAPMHSLYRAMINPIFTPKALAPLTDRARAYAREVALNLKGKGECEFMSDFAFEFPIKVFMQLMGLPIAMTEQFLEWERDMLHTNDFNVMRPAALAVGDYLREQIADRRKNPKDDLFTYAVQAKIDGREMTEDELVGFTFNLFVGGLDTVSTNMGLQFMHLTRRPDHQKQLRENPSLIPAAIEELMRAYSAVMTFRICVKETTIRGVKFMPGDKVVMSTALAGRDPSEYANPDEVRFDRQSKHLGYAYGPHLCVGIHMARLEMRIAMEEFLAIIPEFKLPDDYTVRYRLGMIQPVELPLLWKA